MVPVALLERGSWRPRPVARRTTTTTTTTTTTATMFAEGATTAAAAAVAGSKSKWRRELAFVQRGAGSFDRQPLTILGLGHKSRAYKAPIPHSRRPGTNPNPKSQIPNPKGPAGSQEPGGPRAFCFIA